ncbi:uncharacterized protein RCO7_11691 [Rhynchosporium graminicola]|uniref:Uncharacterized protein n=1 Tax=Rhynchosporium graminicola TaxID=2792576 RepID=A0A1E1LTI1_9HELO|nr:uncharacterized protein RCO7_11691 [Rhynchosporium commune]
MVRNSEWYYTSTCRESLRALQDGLAQLA